VKLIACGSRTWKDGARVRRRLAALPAASTIVVGASPGGGADLHASIFGAVLGHTIIHVPINADDRRRAGITRRAPILRNLRMFNEHPDVELLLAFWDGKSQGTDMMIGEAHRRGIPYEVIS
jgi:hypothetical protein